MPRIRDILNLGPVMPVIVIDDSANAVPLAGHFLKAGSQPSRSRSARRRHSTRSAPWRFRPDITVGAGTVTRADLAAAARDAGAAFAVSPGTTPAVIKGCAAAGLPLLPGASSASEMMALNDQGFDCVKFFPANAAGGTAFIKALVSPLPDISVCPTGGITEATAPEWLGLANVPCVGGSWVAPRDAIAEGAFEVIATRARAAAAL